jgi:hypothetical protein
MPHSILGQLFAHWQLEDRALIHSILLDRPLHSDYSSDADVQEQGMQAQVCMGAGQAGQHWPCVM